MGEKLIKTNKAMSYTLFFFFPFPNVISASHHSFLSFSFFIWGFGVPDGISTERTLSPANRERYNS